MRRVSGIYMCYIKGCSYVTITARSALFLSDALGFAELQCIARLRLLLPIFHIQLSPTFLPRTITDADATRTLNSHGAGAHSEPGAGGPILKQQAPSSLQTRLCILSSSQTQSKCEPCGPRGHLVCFLPQPSCYTQWDEGSKKRVERPSHEKPCVP